MTREQIVAAVAKLCTLYGRQQSETLTEQFLEDFADWHPDAFAQAVQAHRRDTDRGRFFPTLADLLHQSIGDRNQAKVEAAAAFDSNPLIDGTSKFDADRETYDRRDQRKRAYVARAAYEFEAMAMSGGAPQAVGFRDSRRLAEVLGIPHDDEGTVH
jgi:hypothetical protein